VGNVWESVRVRVGSNDQYARIVAQACGVRAGGNGSGRTGADRLVKVVTKIGSTSRITTGLSATIAGESTESMYPGRGLKNAHVKPPDRVEILY